MKRAPFAALLVLAILSGPSFPQDEAEATRARLADLESRISSLRAAQNRRLEEQGLLQQELRNRELQLADLAKELDSTRADLRNTRTQIDELQEQQASLSDAASRQKKAVAAEVRAAYRTGGNDQLRLLLSEEDPQALARMLAYYRYILGARAAILDEYRDTLASLDSLETELARKAADLDEQRDALARQQDQQQQAQRERQRVLAGIEQALADDAARIAAAQEEQAELDTLLQEIEAALAQLIPEDTVEAFSEARGTMAWPVDGRITERFGRPRNQGKMRWQGVRLAAETGSTVAAIHHGRVVYADWLRGAGLLLVIDHGQGYMSLYAHNESLLRDVGDWVTAGAAVATVGNSGGQSEPGLYFEIRKDGKPTDPQGWCRG